MLSLIEFIVALLVVLAVWLLVAFSPDDRQYDALGVELEYKLWER